MKLFKKITAVILTVLMLAMTALSAGAATLLDETQKITIDVACDKTGYVFELFKVADLESTTASPYSTEYTSLVDDIDADVLAGDTETALSNLDALSDDEISSQATSCGEYDTDSDGTTYTFTNLDQGIYYIRAMSYPADTTAITNSLLALPYYTANDGWVYSYDTINLAEKVVQTPPETHKVITNSTKNDENYTDVSLGDKVNFRLENTVTGSKQIRLTTYTVYDVMSKGLTLDHNSFVVYLADKNKDKIENVDTQYYTVNVTSESAGSDTEFNVALTKDYLALDNFYESDVAYVMVEYSADLNQYAVKGEVGNPNEDAYLEYGNTKNTDTTEGNTVYVYTYGLYVDKTDESGNPLAGATFELYATQSDAQSKSNALASGTSDSKGYVEFINSDGNEISLQSGTYYVVETEAPADYNVYGNVITVDITAEYTSTITNGTYVTNCPEDGYASVTVKDTKVTLPKTGGFVLTLSILGGVIVLAGLFGFMYTKRKKASAK